MGSKGSMGRAVRAWGRRIAATLITLLISLVGVGLPQATAAVVIDRGHVDAFFVTADSAGVYLDLQEDVTGMHVRRAPEEVVLKVGEHAWHEAVPGLNLPGYLLPLTARPDLLWPGWDTNGVAAAGLGPIDLVFTQVSGPGRVFLFTQKGLAAGIAPLISGSYEVASGSVLRQEYPAHTHAYWMFEAPGDYVMQVKAVSPQRGQESQVRTYTWRVGDRQEAPAPTPAPQPSPAPAPETSPGQPPAPGDTDTQPGTGDGDAAAPGESTPPAGSTQPKPEPKPEPQPEPGPTATTPTRQPAPGQPSQPQPAAGSSPGLLPAVAVLATGLAMLAGSLAFLLRKP